MFCVYKEGAVVKTFRGNQWFITDTGDKQPPTIFKLWSREELATLDIYHFTDNSKKSGYDNEFYVMGATVDSVPNQSNGEVIRTSIPVERNVDVVKAMIKSKITTMRSSVAHDGVVYMDKNFVTERQIVDSINLIAIELADDAEVPWDTMDTEKVPTEVFTMTGAEFKGLRDAIAAHYLACTVQTRVHIDAVDAKRTFNTVTSYDYTTDWPVNPDRSEPD